MFNSVASPDCRYVVSHKLLRSEAHSVDVDVPDKYLMTFPFTKQNNVIMLLVYDKKSDI